MNPISHHKQGRIQDFPRGGLNIEMISEAGGLEGTDPRLWFFSNITPKSCLIQDLEHI